MKTIIAAILAATVSLSANASYQCFAYNTANPDDLMLYKVKVVKAKHGESQRLSGIAIKPNEPDAQTLYVEGSVLRLADGHHNIYMAAINFDGTPAAAPVYVQRANYPSYSGVDSDNFYHIDCADFHYPLELIR